VWQLEERRVPSTLLVALTPFNNTNGTAPVPNGPLLEDSSGNLFGTTLQGGLNGDGTVFELAHGSNTLTTLATFDNANGKFPFGGLIEDGVGDLFGTTEFGGANGDGTVFEVAHGSNTITTIASFTNGADGGQPTTGLVADSSFDLFGTTTKGGSNHLGTVFEIPNNGTDTIFTLASFSTRIGTASGNLVQDSNGNFFGTTGSGGANNAGTVFELPQGSTTLKALASFDANNGASPLANSLIEDSSTGNLFGTTASGGANGAGSVFELAQGGKTITTLASFNMTNGQQPVGLVEDSNGNLFGTTASGGANGGGTVFELAQGSSTLATLASLDASTGTPPSAGLVEDSRGNFFGTTTNGGANSAGTVFELDQGPTISTQPQGTSATVGQTASVALTVAAIGGVTPLTVQWQISTDNGSTFSNVSNGIGVSGATSTLLTLSGFSSAGAPEYRAVVTDGFGVTATSSPATLTISAAPAITTPPQDATATVGQSGAESFTIATSGGTTPLTVQWQVSTDNGVTFTKLSDGNGIFGSGTTTLTLTRFSTSGSAEYQAIVHDANGVTVMSDPATLTINTAPSITTQPANQSATTGQAGSESFSVGAINGTSPFTFQWQVSTNGGNTFTNLSNRPGISGATTSTLTINGNALPASGTKYQVLVTDVNGVMVTSTAATLTINAAPSITTQPQNAVATVGQTVPKSFMIAASGGTAPLGVQWQISTNGGSTFSNLSDGNGVTGTTTATLTISSFPSTGSAAYRAIVTDANGVTATSNAATLTIAGTPNQSWLTQVYADFFHRPLDASGLATWGNQLNQGMSRTQVVQLIQTSLEYRTDVVEALYSQLLHRAADPSGLSAYTSFLGSGGTAEQVEAALLGSPEYFQLHGGTNNGFLSAVYQDVLNRALDAGGAQTWGALLAGGSSPAAVAGAILASLEAQTEAVESYFNEFLHRPADATGLNGFTMALQQGVPSETVIASIVGSDEYFARTQ
jgi:uncharacterized repeat protein (TIGR03803 family)